MTATKPTARDVIITRRIAKLDTNSVLRVPPGHPMPRALTKREVNAAADMLRELAEVVRRCALAAGVTRVNRTD